MRSLKALREDRQELLDELGDIVARAEKENRDLNEVEAERVDVISEMLERNANATERRQKVDAQLKAEFAAKVEREGLLGGLKSAAKKWSQNADGKRYAILGAGDKLTDYTGKPKVENSFGHYILAKIFGEHPSGLTPREIKASLGENKDGLTGGFLVPDEMFGDVWDLARARVVLPQAGMRIVAMSSGSMTIPRLTQDITISNKAENAEGTPSDMKFVSHMLSTYTAFGLQEISREIWEDSPQLLAAQLDNWFAQKMAVQIDSWGLNGTGSQEPAGILLDSSIGTTGSIGTIDWTDISNALLQVRENNHEPTSVIMSPANLEALQTIDGGDGTNSTRAWLLEPASVSGRSLFATTSMPDTKIICGDFSHYLMGMRTQPLVETTTGGDAFKSHQVWAKITMRYDFCVMDPNAFHILEGVTV